MGQSSVCLSAKDSIGKAGGFCAFCTVRDQSFCADFVQADFRTVEQTMAHIAIKEEHTIIVEGETSDYIYMVVSGAFRIVRLLPDGRRQITGFVFAGDYLGLGQATLSDFTAEALEPSLVCRFSHGYLQQMGGKYPTIKDRLIAKGQDELHKARDHIVLLGKTTAEERVLSFLQMVAFRSPEKARTLRFYLPMSRQDVADYLGLRMETLSRTLTKLKKRGVIKEIAGRVIELASGVGPALMAS